VKNAIHASSAVEVLSAGWKCFNLAVDLIVLKFFLKYFTAGWFFKPVV